MAKLLNVTYSRIYQYGGLLAIVIATVLVSLLLVHRQSAPKRPSRPPPPAYAGQRKYAIACDMYSVM